MVERSSAGKQGEQYKVESQPEPIIQSVEAIGECPFKTPMDPEKERVAILKRFRNCRVTFTPDNSGQTIITPEGPKNQMTKKTEYKRKNRKV